MPVTMPSVGNFLTASAARQPRPGGQRELAVLYETPRVAKIVDVFPGRALLRLAALGYRVRPGCVERDAPALVNFRQIGPHEIKIGGFGRRRPPAPRAPFPR